MGLVYDIPFDAIAVTAAQDFIEYVAPADSIAIVHGSEVGQTTDVGDAAEENLAIRWRKGATVSGSGGATVTPLAHETGSPAAGGTAERNNTTKATGGNTLRPKVWNVRQPYEDKPVPKERLVLSPSERLTLELVDAPADSLTCSGSITIEEVGG